jgi:putative phosphoribosyl transferase
MRMGLHAFPDRTAAGQQLARALADRNLQGPLLVLGLPRGGVPVAYEVARALQAPLDVMVVRKVGMPGQPELAIGAIASGDITVRAESEALIAFNVPFEQLAQRERVELERRERAYRAGAPPIDAKGKTVILVDDGLATGATMLAAVRAARKLGAAAVVVAAPVASQDAVELTGAEADDVVVLVTPALLFSISQWYDHFEQVDDTEVRELLQRAKEHVAGAPSDT